MSGMPGPETITHVDEIKRTTSPHTTNGQRWEVQLSAIPSREWLDLFKVSGEVSKTAAPQRVEFDRACAVFKSDEDHVGYWIESTGGSPRRTRGIGSGSIRCVASAATASRPRPRKERGFTS